MLEPERSYHGILVMLLAKWYNEANINGAMPLKLLRKHYELICKISWSGLTLAGQ